MGWKSKSLCGGSKEVPAGPWSRCNFQGTVSLKNLESFEDSPIKKTSNTLCPTPLQTLKNKIILKDFFFQYFWHIPFMPLFCLNDKETSSWALLEPSRATLLQISSFLGEQECWAGHWRLSRDDSHMPLGRSQGVAGCFFSLPILMNYKTEPKLTGRRTLSGPHTLEMLIGEDLFQLFDLIKGSCFSIDFCALQSFPKQEPGSFPGTIWIPVRCQSLLKDNCLESRSFWILIHSYNDGISSLYSSAAWYQLNQYWKVLICHRITNLMFDDFRTMRQDHYFCWGQKGWNGVTPNSGKR